MWMWILLQKNWLISRECKKPVSKDSRPATDNAHKSVSFISLIHGSFSISRSVVGRVNKQECIPTPIQLTGRLLAVKKFLSGGEYLSMLCYSAVFSRPMREILVRRLTKSTNLSHLYRLFTEVSQCPGCVVGRVDQAEK